MIILEANGIIYELFTIKRPKLYTRPLSEGPPHRGMKVGTGNRKNKSRAGDEHESAAEKRSKSANELAKYVYVYIKEK